MRQRRRAAHDARAAVKKHAISPAVMAPASNVIASSIETAATTPASARSTIIRLKRLFLYGPAHRAQMLAETQGGRVLALGKVGAELYLAA